MIDAAARLDELLAYSDKVYAAIDQTIDGQPRHRAMLRLGTLVVADALRANLSAVAVEQAGLSLHEILALHLRQGGVTDSDTAAWPTYELPSGKPPASVYSQEVDRLAELYADTFRITLDRDGGFETDSSHAIHLAAMAVPYAAEYHPELNINLVIIYAWLHDIVEAYSGDTMSFGITPQGEQEKQSRETAALDRIKQELAADYPGFVAIIENYEHLVDRESRFVKTFDKLDPGYTWLYSGPRATLKNLPSITSRQKHIIARADASQKIARLAAEFTDCLQIYFEMSRRVDAHARFPNEADDFEPDVSSVSNLERLYLAQLSR